MESESLCTATQYEKKKGDYVEKRYTLHLSQIVVYVVISKFNLLCDCALYKVIN